MHALGWGNFDGFVVVLCHTLGDADCKRTHFAGRPVNQYHFISTPANRVEYGRLRAQVSLPDYAVNGSVSFGNHVKGLPLSRNQVPVNTHQCGSDEYAKIFEHN